MLVVQQKRAHVESQLQVNHLSALHVLTKQKFFPVPGSSKF